MASVYKRGKVFWGRVQRGGREHRQSLGTSTRAVAEKRLKEWMEQLEAIQWGDVPRRTYREAMTSFFENHVRLLRPKSQTRYGVSGRKLYHHFNGLYLDEITSAKLSEYEALRRAEGASEPTIRRDLACLSSMFTHVIVDLDWGWDTNPVGPFLKRQSRRRRLRESPPRTRYLTHDEEAALIGAATARGLADQIAFAIDTGLRLEEMFGLTWDRVSLPKREIYITKELAKGARPRTVPLMERAAQLSAQLPRHIRPTGGPDWVFAKPDGSRYPNRKNAFASAVNRAGLNGLIWHDLRRTCGCRLLQDYGLTLHEVRDWLGHESVTTTERAYAFLGVDQLHKRTSAGTILGTGATDSESG